MQKRRIRWVSDDGWDVEMITLGRADLLRVRYRGYIRQYCTAISQVSRWVPLEDLTEITVIN